MNFDIRIIVPDDGNTEHMDDCGISDKKMLYISIIYEVYSITFHMTNGYIIRL